MQVSAAGLVLASIALISPLTASGAQSLGNAGTIEGTVTDPSGALVAGADAELVNTITGYRQAAKTDTRGLFRFTGIPPNPYHLYVSAPGFAQYHQDVSVRSSVPVSLKIAMELSGQTTQVTVDAGGAGVIENVPYAHNDVDRTTFDELPSTSPASGLSDAIVLSTPGVAADSNGFFHPLGDHAQTTFAIDGQPISDQQSKQFSTQVPLNAIQSMELITGAPGVEFGDKTSLVVNAQTRSGLGQKPFGSFAAQYGSFGTVSEQSSFGWGGPKLGNFVVFNALRSGRFLDTPELYPMHAIGNNGTFFDRLDYQPNGADTLHLNVFAARNWFQVPNTYDQPGQDQRQRVNTINIAPGYQRVFNPRTLGTLNLFFRQDRLDYYPSRDPFADLPATLSQDRYLTNYGLRGDLSYVRGAHSLRFGTQIMQTRLRENFSLGITDPGYNAVCVDESGNPQALPSITDPAACTPAGFLPSPELQPGLVPFDLTRGGGPFRFNGRANVNQYAFYAQDAITLGEFQITAGLRVDQYNGLTSATGVQPRIGASYHLHGTGTVLRAAYSRTFETPYNENLVLSSSTGSGGLAANVFGALASKPIEPGRRNQYNVGFQQAFGKFLVADADYFWKYTNNAFDFGTLLNTPIQFPISWRKSKIDGVSVRLSTPNLAGFQAITTMGHTRARYFGPSNGGLIFNSPLDNSVFRIDHDQAFQQTTQLRYQRPRNGPWAAFTWRYDSGLVAGAVPDLESALALTDAQQVAIGFFCGGQRASLNHPITACDSGGYGAVRLRIPAPGTADPDHNPARIAPRHIFDVGAGVDNLFHSEPVRTSLKFTVLNLTNNAALYNFLSTFSGTHFVAPRTYQAEVGFTF